MILIGPSPSSTRRWSWICLMAGKRYAKVLPEPVSAIPMTSLPERSKDMDWACMGKGFLYYLFSMMESTLSL